MGFGHRVYKSYDPRAKIVKKLADEVFESGRDGQGPRDRARAGADRAVRRLLRLAEALPQRRFLHRADLSLDEVPDDFFTVLFAIARTAGWLAQWEEMLLDKEQKIARPRQLYVGKGERDYPTAKAESGKRKGGSGQR